MNNLLAFDIRILIRNNIKHEDNILKVSKLARQTSVFH